MNKDNEVKKNSLLTKAIELFTKKPSLAKLISCTQVTTTDGLQICYDDDEITPGETKVYSMDDQGNQIPVEDDTYTLQDGSSIVVAGGVITEMTGSPEASDGEQSPDEEADDVNASAKTDAAPAENSAPESAANSTADVDVESRVQQLEKTVQQILTLLESMQKDQSVAMMKVKTQLSKLGALPADDKIDKEKGNLHASKKTIKDKEFEENMKELRKAINLGSKTAGVKPNQVKLNKEETKEIDDMEYMRQSMKRGKI
jgi:hypothetical protein